ncbi:SNF2-related protein, partial [Accumulibacter sp.]|uniref:DEAD/DEAH box helicase n=1 Tax=Accumulibacter sp. TaxID=2053492 RepID=UPI001A62C3F0
MQSWWNVPWADSMVVWRPVCARRSRSEWRETIARLRQRLSECRLQALLRLLDGAEAVLAGREPASDFFVAGRGQRWQEILLALQAVVNNQPATDFSGDTARLLWSLSIHEDGCLRAITPLEQKRGPRGWGRPQGISLGRLLDNGRMPLDDARIVRAIRTVPGSTSRHYLDLAAAIVELVGHPRVVVSTAPEEIVDLSETPPELALIRQGEHFVMRIEPPLRASTQAAIEYYQASPEERREAEALRLITLVHDTPQRLRLVRFTAAQRHAAQLIAGELTVPASTGAAQLEKTLHLLSAHFQIDADSAQAARQVDSDSRLHAELSPVGESLRLRLVVTPLGANGPRLPPGSGRRQVMAVLGGETVGGERDFAAERHHLEAVLDALPFLDDADADGGWLIEDLEQALHVVETLPTLPAVAAVDWPQGKRLRVVRLDPRRLRVRVSRAGDWFRLSGQATVDEGLVLTLETLLGAATASSRFVPIGDGVYAALTRALKQIAAVLESDRHGSKVPLIAAAWLDALLADTETAATADFRRAIEGLRLAQASEPKLPSLLQASLRPYQEDGYRWAIRLATAGIGGCLADDMGLGKTLQALAVLLQRAAGGPALVIAPTSVCGNWLAEAQRFAPSLKTRLYSEARDGEREAVLATAGPHDLLIVSYMLLQLSPERFSGRTWHTVIADEAQAIKNAATRRSQAVFGLTTDFRLALTGTPVENRLADLWSIMRFANPGLLGNSKRFNQRFAAPIERYGDRAAQHILRRLIAPFVLRRTKSEVLQELPQRTELVLTVSPDGAEAAHYEALRRLATQEIAQTRDHAAPTDLRFTILTQLTRLRRAACDPRLTSPLLGIAGAKVQAFAELASELTANGHKALVFSQFVDFLSLLREPLDAAGIRYQYLDGATPAADRSRRVAAFQAGDGDLFLISLKAGGFGLNLTAADYVVITDPWWNPAAEDQAMGRAHRIGQLRPV